MPIQVGSGRRNRKKWGPSSRLTRAVQPSGDWLRKLQTVEKYNTDRDIDEESFENTVFEHAGSKIAYYVLNLPKTLSDPEGKLFIGYWARKRLETGQLGALKLTRVNSLDLKEYPSRIDQRILPSLMKVSDPDSNASSYSYGYGQGRSECILDPLLQSSFLPELCATGRFLLSEKSSGPSEHEMVSPLRYVADNPWQLELLITAESNQYCLTGLLKRGTEQKHWRDLVAVLESGFLIFGTEISPITHPFFLGWIETLREQKEIRVPKSQGSFLVEKLLTDPVAPFVVWPKELEWQRERGTPHPRVVFTPPDRASAFIQELSSASRSTISDSIHVEVEFDYEGTIVSSSNKQQDMIVDVSNQRIWLRDFETESKFVRTLENLVTGGSLEGNIDTNSGFYSQVPLDRFIPLASQLIERGWEVYAEKRKLRISKDFGLIVSSGIDWFDLQANTTFAGIQVALPELLKALKKGENLIELGDGTAGILPAQWLSRYAPLAKMGESTQNGIRFKKTQGLLLNAWLGDEKHLKVDSGFRKFQAKIASFQGIKSEQVPEGFRGKLRTYQKEGLAWFEFIKTFEMGGILADDMGLGKTVQFLAFLKKRKLEKKKVCGPSIVIVPKSLVFNWVEEASRFVPDLRVLNYTGLDRAQLLPQVSKADLIVTTYATMRLDIDDLKKLNFDIVVVDEAQAIKNPEAQTSVACKLLNARHRFAMTGTPIENSLEDLFSILDFTSPSLLNLPKNHDLSATSPEMLGKALRPFILRRTKERVLKELPKKTEQTLYCELNPQESRRYNQLRDHFRFTLKDKIEKSGWGQAKIHVLEALLRLRQAACHPGLLDKKKSGENSSKLDTLVEHLHEVIKGGHKALVFSQFTSFLSIVRARLERENIEYEYLDGKTQDRQRRVKRFQSDKDCSVFLISLKAGGTGLNLTEAGYVFILDPWWNPAVESQAIDRTHRIGQTQKVFAYKMIARGTIEEKILRLQKNKRKLAESVVSDGAGFLRKMTREDLELLLS